jgi:glycosyltransferase involved in cell wall biosynthesis
LGVSVITPFYNRAQFLPSVIGTLARQAFKDFELIVVDDGSSDGLANAIESLRVPFPLRLVQLARNKGAASARNAGIAQARGRYVAFLDSDDSWHPDKLLRQFDQLEADPDRLGLVSLTRQLVVGERTYVAPRRLAMRGHRVGQYLFQSGGIIQSSMMFMAIELAKSVQFPDGIRGHDDWSFALRLEQAGARFEMLAQALTIYNDKRGRPRLSPSYSPARLEWLEQWRRELGEAPYLAARAAFGSNMAQHRSLASLAAIGAALAHRAIPAWRAAYYAATWALPWLRSYGVRAKTTWLSLRGTTAEHGRSSGRIESSPEGKEPSHP